MRTTQFLSGILFETAAAWHSGMNSALYSFVSTETIHSDEHRKQLAREVSEELDGEGLQESILHEERNYLKQLLNFILTAPLNVELSAAVLTFDGKYVSCESREFVIL